HTDSLLAVARTVAVAISAVTVTVSAVRPALAVGIERAKGILPIPFFEQRQIRIAEQHLNLLDTFGAGLDERLQRLTQRNHAKIVLGVEVYRAIHTVQEGGNRDDLVAVFHEILVDQFLLRHGTGACKVVHTLTPSRFCASY